MERKNNCAPWTDCPVVPGDVIYFIKDMGVKSEWVDSIEIGHGPRDFEDIVTVVSWINIYTGERGQVDLRDYGKTWFIDEIEAKLELKEMLEDALRRLQEM